MLHENIIVNADADANAAKKPHYGHACKAWVDYFIGHIYQQSFLWAKLGKNKFLGISLCQRRNTTSHWRCIEYTRCGAITTSIMTDRKIKRAIAYV